MPRPLPAARTARPFIKTSLIVAATALSVCLPALAKLETWREESASAFGKGRKEQVVVSDTGRVRLALRLSPVGTIDAPRVWDLALGPKGEVYAATGDEGKVMRRDPEAESPWAVFYDAADTQALSLAVGKDGHVFAGTGPSGQVIDITDPKHPSSRPDPSVQYIWDLATDPSGNLYAATGPTGQLWKRSTEGAWSLLLDSKHSHLLCVALGAEGSVYAGSDGDGLVYRVAPGGKVSVLYDASQSEIRALVVGSDDSVYAGTAAESGSSSSRGATLFGGGPLAESAGPGSRRSSERLNAATPAQDIPPTKPELPKKDEIRPRLSVPSTAGGGSATVRSSTPGENAVYRIDKDGVARELFRAKVLIYALALRGDHLLVGTGPEGQLFEVRQDGHESSPVARLDNGQILALMNQPDGSLLVGAGDPGRVARLGSDYVASGILLSDVHDTKLISRFGALDWRAGMPKGTSVALQVRTGNVAEPDATWSDWPPEQTAPTNAAAKIPAGRFVQYRVTLSSKNLTATPELHSVTLRYQTANLAPEISKLDIPDVSTLDGATRQTRLNLRWDVNDPNDDDLEYFLSFRKEGWPDWVKLTEQPLTEKTFSWDITAIPSGLFRVRLTASDRPSNNANQALTGEKLSEPFLVDHEPPEVKFNPPPAGASHKFATVTLIDQLTRVAKTSYAVDSGEWLPVFPEDGLFDTSNEQVSLPLINLKPGTHLIVVRATDAAGNVGTGDSLVTIPDRSKEK